MFGDADLPHPAACYGRTRVLPVVVPVLTRHPRRGWRKPHCIDPVAVSLSARGLLDALSDACGLWTMMGMATLRARLDWIGAMTDGPVCWPGLLHAAPADLRTLALTAVELEADVDLHGLAGAAARHGWPVDDAEDAVHTVRGIRQRVEIAHARSGAVTVQTPEAPHGLA